MRKTKVILGLTFAGLLLSACGNSASAAKTYTYHDYLTVSPGNWNELTYEQSNDQEIMQFVTGSLFTFNYKFDANGKIESGAFSVEYDGAKQLEDVTEEYAGNENWAVPEDATAGYAYKITLRDDLKWDDGTPIHAKDFVYSMKEQENPLFLNYRADSYYLGSTVIHNAQNYVKQGQSGIFASKGVFGGVYSEDIDDELIFDAYPSDSANGGENSYIYNWWFSNNGHKYDKYFLPYSTVPAVDPETGEPVIDPDTGEQEMEVENYGYGVFAIPMLYNSSPDFNPIQASIAMDGKTFAEIKADATLKSYWDFLIGWWQTDPGEELDFFVTNYTFPEMSFDKVGLFVGANENELILVLDKALVLLNDDGTLNYKAAYNLQSLPLVKESLYEQCKKAPTTEGGLWTTNYNTSVETSASWGPYKLTFYQAGKQHILERNPNWYGYNMDSYKGQYKTDRIVVDIITNYDSALLAFKAGDITSIGIDASVADDYKNSSRAVFTASDFVSSLQLQSDENSIRGRSTAEKNKTLLLYKDFRNAVSLAIDRADFSKKCTTASQAGFGLFNSMHYYDVANGGVYRNEDVAKLVLCEVYGVNVDEYESLEDAYQHITGYNLTLARELLTSAYNEAKEAGDITDSDKVVFVLGTAEDTKSTRRIYDYLNAAFQLLAVDTPLEGRMSLEFDTSFGDNWATDFRSGAYDICTGGWSGAAWDPGYFLMAYLSPDYMYSQGWDTSKEELTLNPYDDGDPDHEYTMSLISWWECLNGISEDYPYNWSEGVVDNEVRLTIIAALEKAVLRAYYSIPLSNSYTASMISYQVEYITREYNTFMGYGGIRYLTYNYSDQEWAGIKSSYDYTK